MTGRYSVRSGTHSVPIGAPGGWGLVAWEKTIGDLLSDAGYTCAVYGKWHVGEGPGRWPTDKGFAEWYGPPRTYDEALWPTDPFYDPERDPVSRMVEIKRGEADVTELEQMTLEVRRDCDGEFLRRATAFVRGAVSAQTPFKVYFNHSLMHMPVIPRDEFKGKTGNGDWADSLLELDADFGALLDLLDELDVARNTIVVFAGITGPRRCCCGEAHRATGRGLVLRRRRGRPAHPVHRPLAGTRPAGSDQQRDHARDRLVHHAFACRWGQPSERPRDRRGRSARLAHGQRGQLSP